MSNSFSQRVNRQLLLAQQQLDKEVDTSNASGRLRQLGMLEAALFHLYRGYLEMLRELAENYQLESPESLADVAELQEALMAVDKTPAEIQELVELQTRGFVADLLAAWHSLFQGPGSTPSKAGSTRPDGLISMRQIGEAELEREKLVTWLSRLREISDRHRDIMVEY